MKIPLREFEQVRNDPRAYLRKRERPSGSDFYGKSKYLTLQRAVFHYHEEKGDLASARKYLEDAYVRQFKDPRSLQGSLDQLDNYSAAFKRLGNSVFKVSRSTETVSARGNFTRSEANGTDP